MPSFINKIKKAIRPKIPQNASYEELLDHFEIVMRSILKSRLTELSYWLEHIDRDLKNVFQKHGVEVASKALASDRFSFEFNLVIENGIESWLATDEAMRKRWHAFWRLYETRLKPADMLERLADVKQRLESEVKEHVRAANQYGRDWTMRADAAGLQISSPITRNTIRWFANLTTDELLHDYERERRTKK